MRKRTDEAFAVCVADGEHILDMEVLAVDSFGIVAAGVHLITYVMTRGGRKYWVQRRSKNKTTFPSVLDSTASGNYYRVRYGLMVWRKRLMKKLESQKHVDTQANVKACRAIFYHMSERNDGRPGSLPHMQYNCEKKFPQNTIPVLNDGEVKNLCCSALTKFAMR